MFRFLFFIFLISSVALSTGCGEDRASEPPSDRILSKSPFASITDSIKRDPNNPQLLLERALRLSQHNFHEVATGDYKKAWELTNDEGVALEYASNLILAGDAREAVTLLEACSRRFPDNTEFNRRLGELYAQAGNYKRALSEYDGIIKRDSGNFEAWYDKGALLARMNDTAGAINALEISFEIMPIGYSGIALANLYASMKNPRALVICDVLIRNDSSESQTEAIYLKGVYFSESRQYAKAIEQFDECIRRDWKMTDAYLEKGILLFEMREFEEALKVFTMAATVSNTTADAYYWMGRCYEETGRKEEAIANYQRAISLDHRFIEAERRLERLKG